MDFRGISRRASEDREHGEHEPDGAVLEDEGADGDLPVELVEPVALGEALHHHRGAAHAQERPHEDPLLGGGAREIGQDAADEAHQQDLEEAAAEGHAADGAELGGGELETQCEEEEDDPELGQGLHLG